VQRLVIERLDQYSDPAVMVRMLAENAE